jgi:predicted nucleotidyltransferase
MINDLWKEEVAKMARITSPSVGEIEREFTNHLITKLGAALEKVILFGSRAEGRFKPWSDYDLLIVVTRKDRQLIDGIYELVTDFLLSHGVDISLKIYTSDDYKMKMDLPTPFMQRIRERGVILWSRTSEK